MEQRLAIHIEAFESLAALQTERFDVAYLDDSNAIIKIRNYCDGYADRVAPPLRDIFGEALSINAAGLMIAHNHPSGRPEPSRRDYVFTRRLAQISESLGLHLFDHLIYAGDRRFSFREAGLL